MRYYYANVRQILPSRISLKMVFCDNNRSSDCCEKAALRKGYQNGGQWRYSESYIITSAGV